MAVLLSADKRILKNSNTGRQGEPEPIKVAVDW